jgi:hypothetical protein
MLDGQKFQGCQTKKLDYTSPHYISANYPTLEFVHLAK